MLEAFSPCCEKELILMECRLDNMDFRSKSSLVVSPGWRGIFRRKEDRQDDEPETDEGTAVFAEGDTVPVSGFGLAQKKTVPRPLYTEATLLAAMETCGREPHCSNVTISPAPARASSPRKRDSISTMR